MKRSIFTGKWAMGVVLVLLLGTIFLLAGCEPEETPAPTEEPEPTMVEEEEPTPMPEAEEQFTCPFAGEWATSAHADAESESFVHWDEDGEIPPACAECHSTPGHLDYLGADGSELRVVDEPAEIGTVISCEACHNEATQVLTSTLFPSGVMVTDLGDDARCMRCHQGRASTVQVRNAIDEAGLSDDPDTVGEEMGFINIHYYAAAATQLGTIVMGGYEYEGHSYDTRFAHVEEFHTCIECHDPHTLEVNVEACADCHPDVAGLEDIKDVRLQASLVDYDGDGDITEGVYYEIQGLQEILLQEIQAYAANTVGTPIVYDSHAYPYFFVDTNEDGEAGEDEANYGNRYTMWTPRLLKAAYNYQTSVKDPGAFAHGGKYIIQLLYDSIQDLNAERVEGLVRDDPGHFDGSEEAWRHWDEDGEVPGNCSLCHTAEGLPFFLEEGTTVSLDPSNGMLCRTCHDAIPEFTLYTVEQVTFPSGASLGFEEALDSNLCLECHQGRASSVDVQQAIEGADLDAVLEDLRFINPHYFAAGATLFGSQASGAYQYEGQTYAGRFTHVEGFDTCIECHDPHALAVQAEACTGCHPEASEGLEAIRITGVDYDGDGDTDEGLAGEIQTMEELLLEAVQEYAFNVVGTAIVYDPHSYPYFFVDTNGNGEADPDEANYGNRYTEWTPRLLRAAYNYQYVQKDPGAYSHNGTYIIQALYDTLADMSEVVTVDMTGMQRPEVAGEQ